MQLPLLDLPNPLKVLLGKEFFASIPKAPGVYRFFCGGGSVLYVGKAKNLRLRLMSYQRAKPEKSSRKVIELVRTAHRIEWEICADETKALIRENELLRTIKPPFNVVNTKPEIYSYFGVKLGSELGQANDQIFTQIKFTLDPTEADFEMFGAFKSRSKCHHAFFALRRLFWATNRLQEVAGKMEKISPEKNLTPLFDFLKASDQPSPQKNEKMVDEFAYPWEIITKSRVNELSVPLSRHWLNQLSDFFRGSQFLTHTRPEPELLCSLRTEIKKLKFHFRNIPVFYQNWFEEDLKLLLDFYRSGPLRNTELKQLQKEDQPIILQNTMDDLLVMRSFKTK